MLPAATSFQAVIYTIIIFVLLFFEEWISHQFSESSLRPSPEALRVALMGASSQASRVKEPDRVGEEAKARVRQAGGDPECLPLVLSESEVQFGKYRGQSFRWLLAHDVGYTCGLLASHQKEKDGGNTYRTPLMVHKDGLLSYALLFPEMAAAIRERRMLEDDQTLVGFGKHAKSSYEETSRECQT